MAAPAWDPGRNDTLPPTLTPAVPPSVKLGLTIVYTAFYSLLFACVYAQLWLVLRYGHKRLSYQSVFLFLCLLWASLRTVLFSFYFRDCVAANALSPFVFWLLYCCPVCLQFFTLTLMNLYFAQVSCAPVHTRHWGLGKQRHQGRVGICGAGDVCPRLGVFPARSYLPFTPSHPPLLAQKVPSSQGCTRDTRPPAPQHPWMLCWRNWAQLGSLNNLQSPLLSPPVPLPTPIDPLLPKDTCIAVKVSSCRLDLGSSKPLE